MNGRARNGMSGWKKMTNIYLKNTTIVNQNEWREYLSGEDQEFEANIRTKTRKGLVVGNLEFMKKNRTKNGACSSQFENWETTSKHC